MGRPSEFKQAVADEICERIADGESLRRICLDEHMPARSTVFKWLAQSTVFADQYAYAREEQAETHADGMVDIADEPPPLDQYGKVDGGAVQDKRLRIETRKWIAAKLKPKKYGERIDMNHGGQKDNPLMALLSTINSSALPVVKDPGDE